MSTIQPIETVLGSVRFRSRLEARWSLFLTELNIEWEYEPEDFSLPGRGYRPDFWARTLETWIEIKPEYTPLDHQLAAAIQEQSGSPLLWISGPPQAGAYTVSLCDFGTVERIEGLQFALSRAGALWLADAEQTCCLPLPPRWLEYQDDFPLPEAPALRKAYERTMAWRF